MSSPLYQVIYLPFFCCIENIYTVPSIFHLRSQFYLRPTYWQYQSFASQNRAEKIWEKSEKNREYHHNHSLPVSIKTYVNPLLLLWRASFNSPMIKGRCLVHHLKWLPKHRGMWDDILITQNTAMCPFLFHCTLWFG